MRRLEQIRDQIRSGTYPLEERVPHIDYDRLARAIAAGEPDERPRLRIARSWFKSTPGAGADNG